MAAIALAYGSALLPAVKDLVELDETRAISINVVEDVATRLAIL